MSDMEQPFQFSPSGDLESTTDVTKQVAHNIEALIATRFGERVMMPTYGTSAWDDLFETNTDVVQSSLMSQLYNGIQSWEPRAKLGQVRVVPIPASEGELQISVSFQVKGLEDTFFATVQIGGTIQTSVQQQL